MKKIWLLLSLLVGLSLGAHAQESFALANSATGTTVSTLTKVVINGGVPQAQIVATTDTSGAVGVLAPNPNSGAGTTGQAIITRSGIAPCVFDNTTVAGDYVQISATVAGNCHDVGATRPTSGQIIGIVIQTGGSAGTYNVLLDKSIFPASSSTTPPCVPVGSSDTISSATSFATTCSMPAPAGVGSIIEVDVQGVYTTTVTASPAFQMQINIGGATGTCAMPGKITIVTGQTAGPWNLRCYVQIVTTGAPGTAYVWGMANESGALGGSSNVMPMYNGGAGTSSFTTTSAQTISVQETATLVSGQTFTLQSIFARNY